MSGEAMKLLQKPILKALMRKRPILQSIVLFAVCLLGLIPAYGGESSHRGQILQSLAQADVVFLGETHNRPEDSQAHLEIIQALAQKGKVAIAMEMFQRPYQAAIDAYLQGKISETQLVEQTEYEQRWGFPWENYAPILRFAQSQQIPVLAMNAPSEVTRKVAGGGLEALAPEDWQWIPPQSEIRTDNQNYRQLLRGVFEQHQTGGDGE